LLRKVNSFVGENSKEITNRVCSNIDNMIDKYLNDYRSPRSFTAQQPATFKFASAENQDGVDMMKRSNASLYNSAYYKEVNEIFREIFLTKL